MNSAVRGTSQSFARRVSLKRTGVTTCQVLEHPSIAVSKTALVDDNAITFTVTLDLYESVVHSIRYRERGHRDDWLIGDLYVRRQALPEQPPSRIQVTVSHV